MLRFRIQGHRPATLFTMNEDGVWKRVDGIGDYVPIVRGNLVSGRSVEEGIYLSSVILFMCTGDAALTVGWTPDFCREFIAHRPNYIWETNEGEIAEWIVEQTIALLHKEKPLSSCRRN